MSKIWTCCRIANKYYWRQKANWGMLLGILLLGILTICGRTITGQANNVVGCRVPEEIATYLNNALDQEDTIFQYEVYNEQHDKMIRDIQTGKLCGAVIMEETDRVMEGTGVKQMKTQLYVKGDMNLSDVLREEVANALYQYYSLHYYEQLLLNSADEETAKEGMAMLRQTLQNGNLFRIEFCEMNQTENLLQAEADNAREQSPVFLRAIIALMLALIGCYLSIEISKLYASGHLTGALLSRTFRITYGAIAMALPAVLGLILLTVGGVGCMLMEIVAMLGYALILGVIALLAGRFFNTKVLMALIPVYLLLMMVTSPVFYQLGNQIKIIDYVGKCFPITWYLSLF